MDQDLGETGNQDHIKPQDNDNDTANNNNVCVGPVSRLISDLEAIGCELGEDLIIKVPGDVDIDIWNLPWQHLKKAVIGLATNARVRKVSEARSFCGSIDEIDDQITKKVVNHPGIKEQRVYCHIYTGGFWNEYQKIELQTSDGICQHCKREVKNSSHIPWQCPVVNKHRKFERIPWENLNNIIDVVFAVDRCFLLSDFCEVFNVKRELFYVELS